MKATFDITKLWQSKPKHTNHKIKTTRSSVRSKNQTAKDSWGMSPEDALRVSYSGHK